MILVTGATGNIGSALLKELHAHGVGPLRGLTRDAARAVFPEGVEAVEGNLVEPTSLRPALEGVRSLFLVSRLGSDADVLQAARQAGVEHVVLVSSITVQTHPHLGPMRREPGGGATAQGERHGMDDPAADAVRLEHPDVGGFHP